MITVDAMGQACPKPVVMTKKALAALTAPETVQVLVDNPTAVQNLTRLAGGMNLPCASEQTAEDAFTVTMTVDDLAKLQKNAEGCGQNDDFVIAVGSDCMGNGDDTLGASLMKAFFFAVTQQDKLPEAILFYNSGAKVSSEGSSAVEDLKKLEEQGVEILTCGTCLNFYGLQDKLAVGSVTNMYTIVEKLEGAAKVVRP